MRFLLQLIPEKSLGSDHLLRFNSSMSGNSCCAQFCSRCDFLVAFVFQSLPTFHLFPAESLSLGASTAGLDGIRDVKD